MEIQPQSKGYGWHCSIKQWGSGSANSVLTFPVSVTATYVVVTTSYGANWGYVTDLTTKSFKNANNSTARYIAVSNV